jgi:hypothetical protein
MRAPRRVGQLGLGRRRRTVFARGLGSRWRSRSVAPTREVIRRGILHVCIEGGECAHIGRARQASIIGLSRSEAPAGGTGGLGGSGESVVIPLAVAAAGFVTSFFSGKRFQSSGEFGPDFDGIGQQIHGIMKTGSLPAGWVREGGRSVCMSGGGGGTDDHVQGRRGHGSHLCSTCG